MFDSLYQTDIGDCCCRYCQSEDVQPCVTVCGQPDSICQASAYNIEQGSESHNITSQCRRRDVDSATFSYAYNISAVREYGNGGSDQPCCSISAFEIYLAR